MSTNSLQIKSNYIAGLTSAGDGTTSTIRMSLGEEVSNAASVKFTDATNATIITATKNEFFFGGNANPMFTNAAGARTINAEYANISTLLASTITVNNVTEISTTVSTMTVEGKFTAAGDAYYTGGLIKATGAQSEIVVFAQLSAEVSRASSGEGSLSTRATSDEQALSSEVSRASSAEGSLDTRVDNFRSSVSSIFNGVGAILALSTATLTTQTANIGGTVTATAILALSDARKKKDIEEVVNALSTVDAMHPVYYNWIDHVNMNPAYKEIGFIAQEVEMAIPNVVNTADDEIGTKRVGYDRIVSLLVAAVKELKAEVSTLRG